MIIQTFSSELKSRSRHQQGMRITSGVRKKCHTEALTGPLRRVDLTILTGGNLFSAFRFLLVVMDDLYRYVSGAINTETRHRSSAADNTVWS